MKIVLPPSGIQEIESQILQSKEIRLFIKRDDLLHPHISGNKIRKLKYNLIKAREEGFKTLLTFGGAYSNHIHAVAAAGEIYGFKTIGIIRGEKYDHLNPTLSYAASKGMRLHYLSRKDYEDKYAPGNLENMKKRYGKFYLLPEGGTNVLALKGCKEIVEEIDIPFDVIAVCCGTGGTLGGIVVGLNGNNFALGFPVLKNGGYLKREITDYIKKYNKSLYLNWHLEIDYHFGGYAKYTSALVDFINNFKREHKIQLDPIYTGKLMFGIFDMIQKNTFKKGTRIIVVHTGGLQGIKGFNKRFGNPIK